MEFDNLKKKPTLSQSLTDLQACNQEAIHLVASVQGHGGVLFFTFPDLRIQSASKNIGDFLSSSYQDIIGARLTHIVDKKFAEVIVERATAYPWAKTAGRYFSFQSAEHDYDCYLFHSEGLFGLELERRSRDSTDVIDISDVTEQIKYFHTDMKSAIDVASVANLACSAVRAITQLDRVMIYRFLYPSWHGEVIGEDRVIHAHSFLGHRFPSSDIPQPARDLYLKNSVRIIGDVDMPDSELSPSLNPLTGKTIDLSDSRLRSVSKMHLKYLRNMGVKASLSFAITVRGELWGLIACHHLDTFRLTQAQRSACELIAEAVAAQAPLLETLSSYRSKYSFETRLQKVINNMKQTTSPIDQIFKGTEVLDIFNATGVAIYSATRTEFAGITPRPNGLAELASRIREELDTTKRNVLGTNSLHERLPDLKNVEKIITGLIAVRLPEQEDAIFMIFRPEVIKTIVWGGDPVKQLETKGFAGEINPRVSFETWEEVIRSQSLEWTPYEIEGASRIAEFVSLKWM